MKKEIYEQIKQAGYQDELMRMARPAYDKEFSPVPDSSPSYQPQRTAMNISTPMEAG